MNSLSQFVNMIRRWLEAVNFEDEEQNRLALYLQVTALLTCIAAALLYINYAAQGDIAPIVLITGLTFSLVIWLVRRKQLQAASILFLIAMLGLLTYGTFVKNGVRGVASQLYLVIIIFASLILTRKAFAVYTLAAVTCVGFLIFAEHQQWLIYFKLEAPSLTLFFTYATIIGAVAIAIRILTEHLQNSLQRSRQNERQLATQKAILDQVGQAVVGCQIDNTIIYWNQAATRLYGRTAEEALGRRYNEVIPVQLAREDIEAIRVMLQQGQIWTGELTVNKPKHDPLPILGTLTPLQNEKGTITGWIAIATDLTERKQAEQTLRRSEEMYRRAIMSAGDVPYYRDYQTNRYTFMGENIFQITGYAAGEMTPAVWATLEQEGFPRGALAHLSYTEADRLTEIDPTLHWECDYRIRTRDGQTRWVADTSIKVFDDEGQRIGVIGLLQDITDRKRMLDEVQHLNTELEQRVRERTAELEVAVQEIEGLSYTVSHDLRSPLRAVHGFAQILRDDYAQALPPEAHAHLDRIQENATRMGHLIDSLLEFIRLGRQPLQMQRVDVAELARQALTQLSQAKLHREVEVIIGDLPPAHGDSKMLGQVFTELLDNAIKFVHESATPRIEVGWQAQPHGTVFFVRDNGVGFDMQYVGKLFGVFQRLHHASEFEGIGVGLALVHRILQKHGGRIWAEAAPGQGATFYFTWPSTQ